MKAAVTREAGIIKMEEVPEPETGPNQVKVKIAYAGLCGTDPENLEQRFGLMPPEVYKQPRILGHEASGIIAEIGSNIEKGKFKVGQRVAIIRLHRRRRVGKTHRRRSRLGEWPRGSAFQAVARGHQPLMSLGPLDPMLGSSPAPPPAACPPSQ